MKKRLDTIKDITKPGAKNDAGKLRYDLIDDLAEEAMVAVLTFGALKYTAHGWQKVPEPLARYFAADRRHLRGMRRFWQTKNPTDRIDAETGFPHSAQHLCNAMFLCALDLAENDPSFDGMKAAQEAWERWKKILSAAQKKRSPVVESMLAPKGKRRRRR